MPKVRPGSAEKWSRRAGAATPDYTAGINNPRTDWATATVAAAPTYAAGVQAAITRNGYAKGAAASGSAKWQNKAITKGAPRYSQGVQLGQDDYASAVAPYLQVIEATTLPKRGAKGDPNNIQRVIALNNALRAKKLQLQGTAK
jgi:hypothetical protein